MSSRLVYSSWPSSFTSYKREGTCAALLANVRNRNGPSQWKTERCGTELYLSIANLCVVASILKRLGSNDGQRSAKTVLFFYVGKRSIYVNMRVWCICCFHGGEVTERSKRRPHLELLLEPGSIPWYVVVVVIFAQKRGILLNLIGYTRIILSFAVFHRLIIVYPCRWYPIINLSLVWEEQCQTDQTGACRASAQIFKTKYINWQANVVAIYKLN